MGEIEKNPQSVAQTAQHVSQGQLNPDIPA